MRQTHRIKDPFQRAIYFSKQRYFCSFFCLENSFFAVSFTCGERLGNGEPGTSQYLTLRHHGEEGRWLQKLVIERKKKRQQSQKLSWQRGLINRQHLASGKLFLHFRKNSLRKIFEKITNISAKVNKCWLFLRFITKKQNLSKIWEKGTIFVKICWWDFCRLAQKY